MSSHSRSEQWWTNITYDTFLSIFSVIIELFFREIHPRSTWKVPKKGPVIIVAAPHANQFIDPLILMRVLRHDAKRRVCWLIAAKSMGRKFIGWGSRHVGAVPVGRALDMKKPAEGKIYLPEPESDPTLVGGTGTHFDSPAFQVGGLLVLPTVNNEAANVEIKEILSATEIRTKKPFKGAVAIRQLTGQDAVDEEGKAYRDAEPRLTQGFDGIKFSVAPHVDQSAVYDKVFEKLGEGGCIGMFPEGGSHDRTELLPLKAGVAIMALGALADNPGCGLAVIPCGMNYFHAHKFRSRAVVEFGSPVQIDPVMVEKYKSGERREAVGKVLEKIHEGLSLVTVQAPDYETLMLIQAVRRLYTPKGKKLPLPVIIELNRRLVKGYQAYKNDPRVVALKKSVLGYNKELMQLNIRDHQVSYARLATHTVIFTLIYRLFKLVALSIAVLPGTILFAPVFIAGKLISIRKSREALAASSVKVKARDVVATWKLLVAMALAPALYFWYIGLLTLWTYYNRIGGRVPEWVPLSTITVLGIIIFPTITFGALRFGEIGMDIVKSLRPLFLALLPTTANTLPKLRIRRAKLVEQVTDVINELGPEVYPDFEHQRLIIDPLATSPSSSRPTTPRSRSQAGSDPGFKMSPSTDASTSPVSPTLSSRRGQNTFSEGLPRNESFKNLGSIGVFSSRPGTPTGHSRSRNNSSADLSHHGGFSSMKPMTSLKTEGPGAGGGSSGADEVSAKIRGAMRERGRRRNSEQKEMMSDGSWIMSDGRSTRSVTPTSDFEPEEAKKDI